jgi:pimeloyl-ACP methyl ester carboxylesterase
VVKYAKKEGDTVIAKVNGIDLYYEKAGQGRALVMVHGNGEDHSIFNEAAAELKKEFCVYTVDSRGHGRSTRVAPLHYRNMAADVLDFLEAYELQNVLLYGFSDGGIVGLLAAGMTERITGLAVSGANLSPRGVKSSLRLRIALENLLRPSPLLQLMLREPDIRDEELRRIRAKTLVLAGSGDLIRERETRHIAKTVPGAALRILPGEDHGSYIVHSEKIARILLAFGGE